MQSETNSPLPENLPQEQKAYSKKSLFLRPWFVLIIALIVVVGGTAYWLTLGNEQFAAYRCEHGDEERMYDEILGICNGLYSDGGKECTQNSQCSSNQCQVYLGFSSGASWEKISTNSTFNSDDYLVGKCATYFKLDDTGQMDTDKLVPGCGLTKPYTRDQIVNGEYSIISCLPGTKL